MERVAPITTRPAWYWIVKIVLGAAITAATIIGLGLWVGVAFAIVDATVIAWQYERDRRAPQIPRATDNGV
jgi:hypothetical protein